MSLSLRVPRFWSRAVLVRLGIVFLISFAVAQYDVSSGLLLLLGLGVVSLILRYLRLARTPQLLEIVSDGLMLPRTVEDRGRDKVAFRDVANVQVYNTRRGDLLVVQTLDRTYVYPVAALTDASLLEGFLFQLSERGSRDGAALREQFAQREITGRDLISRRAWITYGLLVLLALVFALQEYMTLWLKEPWTDIILGANVPALVRAGQWERLFTSSLLHGHLLHISLNALALLSLGGLLERLLGGPGFWVVYAGSAVMGSVVSMGITNPMVSLGASGAIFGLLGSLLAIHLRYGASLPSGVRQPRQWWINIFVINVGLSIFVKQVDWAAHVGGFLAGALITFVLAYGHDLEALGRKWQPITLMLCAGMLGFAGVSVYRIGARAQDPNARLSDTMTVLTASVERDSVDAGSLNNIAWTIAEATTATDEQLALAERAAERAVSTATLEEQKAPYLDTLAVILDRRGEHERAMTVEREALALSKQPPFAALIAKFTAKLQKPETTLTLTTSGARLAAASATPLLLCTTVVGQREGMGFVAYVQKGTSERVLLDAIIAPKDSLADAPVEILAVSPCTSVEAQLAPGYFTQPLQL